MFPISYHEPVFRPPSEAQSLLIQVTLGCSNNKCTYCDMYRSKTYQVRPLIDILEDIQRASYYLKKISDVPHKAFICDGDALGAPMSILIATLKELQKEFPDLRRVGIYATARNILEKTVDELKALNDLRLGIAYLGLESGDDQVLKMVAKGNNAQEMREASLKIKEAGFKLSTIAMLGLGGKEHSSSHALNTAKLVSETSPHFFSLLTTCALPQTPYKAMIDKGFISPLSSKGLLKEMFEILSGIQPKDNSIIFRANHVSNMFPLAGGLPRDKEAILSVLEQWIKETPEDLYPDLPLDL